MPNAYFKKLNKKLGVSIGELEKKWDKAKEIVKTQYQISDEKDTKFWALTVGVFKKMLRSKFKEAAKEKEVQDTKEESFELFTDMIIAAEMQMDAFVFVQKMNSSEVLESIKSETSLTEEEIDEVLAESIVEVSNSESEEVLTNFLPTLAKTFTSKLKKTKYIATESVIAMRKLIQESVEELMVEEDVSAADVAAPTLAVASTMTAQQTLLGCPVFSVEDAIFWKIHKEMRANKQWYEKFYGTELGAWVRMNKGKAFYVRHNDLNLYRHVKPDVVNY